MSESTPDILTADPEDRYVIRIPGRDAFHIDELYEALNMKPWQVLMGGYWLRAGDRVGGGATEEDDIRKIVDVGVKFLAARQRIREARGRKKIEAALRPGRKRGETPKSQGGMARAVALTPERRSEISKLGAAARWNKSKEGNE